MRPLQLLLSLLACTLTFTLVLYHGVIRTTRSLPGDYEESSSSNRVNAYFSWRAPSSLFPPSAVISLTDDNSTFFLARPAAFGPVLPAKSLSGQLWIGSGFGDDNVGRNGLESRLEGELGCSDVPGWSDELRKMRSDMGRYGSTAKIAQGRQDQEMPFGAGEGGIGAGFTASIESTIKSDDGTDDHLLAASVGSDIDKGFLQQAAKSSHADIQSLQESAEIAGKVVLLTRGGCGFLDKVKWAQRRGAVAVIVGDDIRGGPLVTMYARGDTSNVTISALFTSHTTAHLLSSLMPQGNKTVPIADGNRLGVAIGDSMKKSKTKSRAKSANAAKAASVVRPKDEASRAEPPRAVDGKKDQDGSGWFWSMFGTDSAKDSLVNAQAARGKGWVMQTEFDETEKERVKGKDGVAPLSLQSHDGFRIGVHDWRDADLVAEQKERFLEQIAAAGGSVTVSDKSSTTSEDDVPRSGEYEKAGRATKRKTSNKPVLAGADKPVAKPRASWFRRLVSGTDTVSKGTKNAPALSRSRPNIIEPAQPVSNPAHMHDIHVPGAMYDEPTEHEGLWVTLTPTSMSSSPFIDTLLVLVVSPLITLTVVYALLILRSRIRRRRWRAPKSVVERLPVRTYQTMPSSPPSSTTSSISTPATVNTPLLSSTAPRSIRPRPRSRTDSQVPAQASSSLQSIEQEEEKREAGLLEWRRKYGGKQKECVVCLEEYVDGVSRVMSLPCGHEFHEGCITPWLTTRRRTCPICKGDVVRSLARSQGSTSSTPRDLAGIEDEDEIQQQAALLHNDDPASRRPISRDQESLEDLERGVAGHVDRDR